jgi:hypothetical protein
LLFKPNDDLSVTLFAMDQRLTMGGYDLLDSSPTSAAPGTVYNAHYEVFPLREGLHDDVQIYAGTINANLGFADLTSATSYFTRENTQGEDASESLYYSNQGAAPLAPVRSIMNTTRHTRSRRRFVSPRTIPGHCTGWAERSTAASNRSGTRSATAR